MKIRLLSIFGLLFYAAVFAVLPARLAFAEHDNKFQFYFHWVDPKTIDFTDTNKSRKATFTYKGAIDKNTKDTKDDEVLFYGQINFSGYDKCPDKRGINIYIKKSAYDSLDTSKPTPIVNGMYAADGTNRTCELSDSIMNDLRKGTYKVGFTSTSKMSSPAGGGETDSEAATSPPSCENKAGETSWMMCPMIRGIDSGLEIVDSQIRNLLTVDANQFNNPGIKNASATIRNLAFIIAVPMMLVMVIGTAIGSDLISAYTVKKALPRLLIAIIFISLSFPLLTFLIGMSNDIGNATLGFMTYPFGEHVGALGLGDLFAPGAGGNGALANILLLPKLTVGLVGLAVILWLFGGTILLFAGVGFLVLIIRQMFIVLLLLLAPLAILAWVFPGNDKLWKAWWSLFSKLLIMFPLIMALIGSGRIFAFIINEGDSNSFAGDIVAPIGKLVAYMAPYAMIPLTFKFAGGIFSQIAGFVDNKEKGLFDRQKQSRAKKLERVGSGNLFKNAPENSFRSRINSAGFAARNVREAGLRPGSMRSNMTAFRGAHEFAEAQEAMQKNHALMAILEDDNLLEAGRGGADAATIRKRLIKAGRSGDALNQGVSAVLKARAGMTNEAFDIAAVIGTAGTSTGYAGGQGEMLAAVDQASGGNQVIYSKLLGAAKSTASRAGRVDLGGNSYGASIKLGETIRNAKTPQARQAAIVAANQTAATQVVDQQGAGALLTAKNGALKNVIPGLQARIKDRAADVAAAHATKDPRIIDLAERDFKQTLADTAGLLDAAGQVSPENSRLIADLVMNDTYVSDSGKTIRVSDAVEALRGDAEFGQKRREYSNAAVGQANAHLQATLGANQPPVIPPPNPGGPPI